MQIQRLKSGFPLSEYAPTWNFPIGIDAWNDLEKVDKIREWLLVKEEQILNEYPSNNDHGTGLGYESVTSRSGQYNLFDFNTELPELNDLLKFLRLSYLEFVTQDLSTIRSCSLVCWFNVIKDAKAITKHSHGSEVSAYLSGNMHLDNYHTKTMYSPPFEARDFNGFDNVKGGVTIFPSCLPHYTDVYRGSTPRVSIAFDIWLDHAITPELKEGFAFYPFMDNEIYEELVNEQSTKE